MPRDILVVENFDIHAVPVNYQWSGYSTDSKEYKEMNFLKVGMDNLAVYICSEENGVALGDYLSKYVIKQPFIRDMEAIFSPGYDYWFFKAWEQAAQDYSELDEWVHKIVDLLVSSALIARFKVQETVYFSFSELALYEEKPLPRRLIQQMETICKDSLIAFCEQYYADYGDMKELLSIETGTWATSVIGRFVQMNK